MALNDRYTPAQAVERMKVSLINNPHFSFMAGIMMIGNTVISEAIPTAQTDGRNVTFNPQFFMNLTDAEKRGLIYHEYGGHIMCQHLTTFGFLYRSNPKLANMACDYVVNQTIKDFNMPEFIKLPQGGLQDDRFRGMDSKQVFDILRTEDDGTDDSSGDGFDSHDWEGARAVDATEQKAHAQEINQALRQSAMASKLLGHPVARDINDWLTPQIDYRQALREFAVSVCVGDDDSTYSRPRRRMLTNDIYMPTMQSNSMRSMLVAIDTSYSITNEHLRQLIPEVLGMCDAVKPEELHICYWGTQVVGHEVYTRDRQADILSTTKPASGGGTSIECVTQFMRDKHIEPTCVVVLTDGYLSGSWGEWSCPVVWVMTTDRRAPIGVNIRLTM
jgi:predicted metal-dependent peptidase